MPSRLLSKSHLGASLPPSVGSPLLDALTPQIHPHSKLFVQSLAIKRSAPQIIQRALINVSVVSGVVLSVRAAPSAGSLAGSACLLHRPAHNIQAVAKKARVPLSRSGLAGSTSSSSPL